MNIEEAIFSKAKVIREGAALRTSRELSQTYVEDACALLGVQVPPFADDFSEGIESEDDAEDFDSEVANDYEAKLSAAGYTTVWNDGYVIYKDLTEAEAEYVNQD